MISSFFLGYWLIWLCCIIGSLGLVIKAFDNHTESWAWLSSPLIIKLFEILDDDHDYFVYKTFTHKCHNHRLRPLPPNNLLTLYIDYLRFLYVSSSSVKTSLLSQVGNVVLIDSFNVLSRVLSMVLFLRVSYCFPDEKKTRSIPTPDVEQPWNCLHILTTSGYVWLTWTYPDRRPVKDDLLTELVIRDVRNWFFFHPLLQLIESLRLEISWYCWDSWVVPWSPHD
jgi:hypothetical protein